MKPFYAQRASMYILVATLVYAPSIGTSQTTNVNCIRDNQRTTVRVLLKESSDNNVQWTISSPEGFLIKNPDTGTSQTHPQPTLTITLKKDTVLCLGTYYTHLQIAPLKGNLSFKSRQYDGSFSVHAYKQKKMLVNHLDLEDYLVGVVPYEAVPSWPEEALKAQCIAARTYALYKIAQRRTAKHRWPYPYDLKSNHEDQTYKGYGAQKELTHIVEETKGIVITHNNKPINAMYTTVCGGVIPSMVHTPASYLKRPYGCTFCKEHSLFRWKCTIPYSTLEGLIRKRFPDFTSIKSIKIGMHTAAGIAKNFIVTDVSNTLFSMTADELRRLAPKHIRSNCCDIVPQEKALHLKGKGWGHFIGLCQYGTYEMARQGCTYQEILSFYYPETALKKLSL